jgi:hypothetical protein
LGDKKIQKVRNRMVILVGKNAKIILLITIRFSFRFFKPFWRNQGLRCAKKQNTVHRFQKC